MSSKSFLVVLIVTVALLAAAAAFQLLEMQTLDLFAILQEKVFGTQVASEVIPPASAPAPAAAAHAESAPAAASAAAPQNGSMFGKKSK